MTLNTTSAFQPSFFPELTAEFPSTRYQGSKAKLANWIWAQIADLDFATCLDAFGGSGAMAYRLKQDEWFRAFVAEANQAIFDNGRQNRALNFDAVEAPGDYDLVYVDPPYISGAGVGVDYYSFYHFLEGLTMYDEWGNHIDLRSEHRRLKPHSSDWTNKRRIHRAFDRLFDRYRHSIMVISYRSDGIPSEAELVTLLKKYKRHVRVERFGRYKYVLSTNSRSKEVLLIGT